MIHVNHITEWCSYTSRNTCLITRLIEHQNKKKCKSFRHNSEKKSKLTKKKIIQSGLGIRCHWLWAMCLNCTLKSLLVCYFRDENFFWICPFMLFPMNFYYHEKLEWPLLLEYRFKLSDKVLQFWCERISFFRVLSQLVKISFLIEFFNAKYKWKTVIDKSLQRAPLLSLLFDIHRIIFTISTLINILLSSRNSVSLLLQKENNTKKISNHNYKS